MKKDVSRDRGARFLLFTDLDGTLLDRDTYRWDQAEPALALCRKLEVPVIAVSSKTRAEMNVLRIELGLTSPFISENGGGIFFPVEGGLQAPAGAFLIDGLRKWSLGVPYRDVVAALKAMGEELGWTIRGCSDMTIDEISSLTGLDLETARLATQREYDEPFLISNREGLEMERLLEAASRRGLRVTEGGRFHHLHGGCDKGEAVEKLVRWYETLHGPVTTIALGDSPNDFAMLERVDYPVLVRSSRQYPGLEKRITTMRTTGEKGPAGWNAAVTAILSGTKNGGDRADV